MERNLTLDYLKLVMSLLIIIIHNPLFWDTLRTPSHLLVNGLCRIAVPCFFILNGLFIQKVVQNKVNLIFYLKRVFAFYVVWMIIYSPFYLFAFRNDLTTSILLNLSNLLFGYWHLWYLIGLLGGVMVLYFLVKQNLSNSKILLVAFLLFIVGWGIQKIELFYPDMDGLLGGAIRSNFPSRNFLFMGFPFVALGYLISQEDSLMSFKKFISTRYIIVLWLFILFVESYLHLHIIGRRGFDFFIALFFLCPGLILALKERSLTIKVNDDFISKLSAAIYFIHPLIIFISQGIFNEKLDQTSQYIIIVFLSMTAGSALIYLNKHLKIFF